ncbi:type II toxin-antitoxin system VapB family antitoxin [Methylobacterium isbiliense]|jgi:hypothetical protein|uniref:Transcription factor n=1 Tax=Methylobacterium isbiliense TaxID=315478 RepID=A0ABQ4SGQ8_9HYPH|nr:type II toxin-antitoxin system VapB family antitoxin [Methylobacterium isbiliense]MDN3626223.1 type II toxin-antitoxin system VapB family antitoxin [Methylobacterium isbiliense]GJE00980.1 hypothetical protein GMJLKIPL_2908 [Methylobacterium isbiliense]
MSEKLVIESDEAVGLAQDIAGRLGVTPDEVVTRALRAYSATVPAGDGLNPTQRAEYDALRALARETARHKLPGATSDHSDLYDENGLPT